MYQYLSLVWQFFCSRSMPATAVHCEMTVNCNISTWVIVKIMFDTDSECAQRTWRFDIAFVSSACRYPKSDQSRRNKDEVTFYQIVLPDMPRQCAGHHSMCNRSGITSTYLTSGSDACTLPWSHKRVFGCNIIFWAVSHVPDLRRHRKVSHSIGNTL